MKHKLLKGVVAIAALGVLAGPMPSSDIGSCTVTELQPADPAQFCEDLRLIQNGHLSRECGLPELTAEELSCENFHFESEDPSCADEVEPLPERCVCIPTDRDADHCLDVLFELEDCGSAERVQDVDVRECGSCPGVE